MDREPIDDGLYMHIEPFDNFPDEEGMDGSTGLGLMSGLSFRSPWRFDRCRWRMAEASTHAIPHPQEATWATESSPGNDPSGSRATQQPPARHRQIPNDSSSDAPTLVGWWATP
jgi:hypothetical protein